MKRGIFKTGNLYDDSIPNAQRQERKRDTTNEPKSRKKPTEQKTKEPTGFEKTSNDKSRKHRREEPPKSAKTNGSSDRRSRHEEEPNSIQKKIESSTNSISLPNNHLEKGSCPRTLRYNARANITPEEDFKKDINSLRKKAEQALVGAPVKFHYRRVDRLRISTESSNKLSLAEVIKKPISLPAKRRLEIEIRAKIRTRTS